MDPTPRAQDRARVRILSYAPESVRFLTETGAPGLLVLADPWYPGWQATVDGRAADCAPANVWMRAAPVPAGRHVVEMRFRSRWLTPGLVLSGVTLLGLSMLATTKRWRPPSPVGEAGPQ
jgi:uncharacterized membrane protein YfhO